MKSECPVCSAPMKTRLPWLSRCPGCGFLKADLEAGAGTGIEGLEALRRQNFRQLLDRIDRTRTLDGLSLLEVGCSTGIFLAEASKRGMTVTGIEPEAEKAAIARSHGFSVMDGFFPAAITSDAEYDIVAFNDVFEHLPDPVSALQSAEALLKDDGLLILNLPSARGILYRIADGLERCGAGGAFDRLWQKGMPSPHLSYFDPGNLKLFLRRHSSLKPVDGFSLPSVSRKGLWRRVRGSETDGKALIYFAGLYGLSFALSLLPSDIVVMVAQKDRGAHT